MISGIILAAGSSTRMGSQKLLLDIDGLRIIEKVVKEVADSGCFDEIILVYHEEAVKNAVSKYNIIFSYNPMPQLGLSSSIKAGIKAVKDNTNAYMFFMGDQPFINEKVIKRLICEYKKSQKSIIVPTYGGNNGMPTIFSSKWKENFYQLEGDVGGRTIIKSNIGEAAFIEIEDDISGMDIDTKEAYKRATEIVKNKL